MAEEAVEQVRQRVDKLYRSESRRVFAALIRILGDFDLAEEALHDAFAAAVEQWSHAGVPAQSPRLAGVDRPLQGYGYPFVVVSVSMRRWSKLPIGSAKPRTSRRNRGNSSDPGTTRATVRNVILLLMDTIFYSNTGLYGMKTDLKSATASKGMVWTGRILSMLPALFLSLDGVMKLCKPQFVVEATVKLGFTEPVIVPLGIVLVTCTVIYYPGMINHHLNPKR